MLKNLSSFSKNKKNLFFIFIFVCVLFLPKIAMGDNTCTSGCTFGSYNLGLNSGCLCPLPPSGKCLSDCSRLYLINSGCACPTEEQRGVNGGGPDNVGTLSSFGRDIGTGIFMGIIRIILWTCWSIAGWSSNLFSAVMGAWVDDAKITTDPIFTKGWTTVRDLANMLIVLGFIVVGIATALRIREYEAKKLLWPLVLVALLINFSGLFCGLIIDASTIVTKNFTQGSGDSGSAIVTAIALSGRTILDHEFAATAPWSFAADALWFSIIYIAVAITYLYISILLIARYAILAMLYILSPMAFAFWVYPASKKLWTQWWNTFLKWCFVAMIGGFFLNIAGSILPKPQDLTGVNTPIWTNLVIALAFIVIGFKITAKSSGLASMASTAVIGLATGGAGFAAGAIAKGASGGAKMANKFSGGAGSAAMQKMSSGYGRAMENIGLRDKGSTAAKRSEAIKDPQNRMSALVSEGNVSHVQKVAKGEGMGRNSVERAGATAALLKSNNLDLDDSKQVAGLTHFQNQGGNLNEYSAKDPRLSRYDIAATRQTIQKEKAATGKTLTDAEAQQKNVDTGYSRLGVKGMRDLAAPAMDLDFMRNTRFEKNIKSSDEYSQAQINQQKKFVTRGTAEYTGWKDRVEKLKKTGTPEALEERRRLHQNIAAIKNNPNFQ